MLEILHKTIKEKKPTTLDNFKTGSLVILEEPTKDEVDKVIDMLKLDEDIMSDSQDANEVPHLESENGVTYIFTRMPYEINNGQTVTTYPVMIAIGDKFVCCLFQRKTDLVDRIRSGVFDYATTQKTKLVFQIISDIHATYSKFILIINRGVRRATVDFKSIKNRDIVHFLRFESTLNDFLAALVHTNTVLNKLLSGRYVTLFQSDHDLIEDNLLENSQLIETSKSNLKNILNIRDVYSTVMTNNLNQTLKFLAVLTIILTIPTIIASLFGMNVALPFQDHPAAFWFIVFIVVSLSTGLLFIFSRSKWL